MTTRVEPQVEPAGSLSRAGTIEQHRRGHRRKLQRAVRLVLLAALVGGLAAALAVAWRPKPVPVDLAGLRRGVLELVVEEEGQTRVKDRYAVTAPLTGNLMRLELRVGDRVKKGQILARMVPLPPPLLDARTRAEAQARFGAAHASQRQALSAVSRAQLALHDARREAERQRQLAARGATVAQAVERAELELRARAEELTSAQFGFHVAEHQVQMARVALTRLRGGAPAEEQLGVTSPSDGRVLRVFQQGGGVVQLGTPVLELGDASGLEVVAALLTSDAVRIPPGAAVRIERWGGEAALRAHLRLIEPSAFTRLSALGVEEQRVNAVIDFDESLATLAPLGDGYRVEARIRIQRLADALVAPAGAVFRRNGEWMAFVLDAGRAQLRPVRVGARSGLEVQVLSGLRLGERVVVYPSDRVADGVRVAER